jgi:hypothetical protein
MNNRPALLAYTLLTLVSVSTAAACGGRGDDQPPVATPTVTFNKDRAAIGSPLTITYRFDVADRKIDGDYWVFVHVLDPEGERLWGDDHQPPVRTSTWQPGKRVEYTRTIFVPNYPYIGPSRVRVGLYMPATGERLTLSGNEVYSREYLVGELEILPQSENIFLIYKEGWHQTEVSSQDPTVEWTWTRKSAAISFRNPKRDATLYVEFDARTDLFDTPQQVTARIGDQILGTFAADSKDTKLVTMPIDAAQLGTAEVTELVLDVDRTFQPGGSDMRELGIRVFHAFVEPRPSTS